MDAQFHVKESGSLGGFAALFQGLHATIVSALSSKTNGFAILRHFSSELPEAPLGVLAVMVAHWVVDVRCLNQFGATVPADTGAGGACASTETLENSAVSFASA